MFIILDRKQLADGIFFSRITDGRYKTNRISVSFFTDFDEARRADYAILPYILTDSCRKYPNLTRLTERFSDLYGASISDNLSCSFNKRQITFRISCIDDRYTINGEKLEQDCCQLLLDCILDPVTENGVFPEKTVDIMRQELIDAIESVKGDKRMYAAQQGAMAAFPGEPAGYPVNGTAEQAQAVTAQSAWEAYRSMLEHSRIEIIAAGRSDFTAAEKLLAERLGGLRRSGICVPAPSPSALKEDVFRSEERVEVQQAILRMYFKAPKLQDRYAASVLSMILGGMTTSRFFENIREKQSLCYYCSCYSNRFYKTLTVYAGVESGNLAKTERAVMKEFMNICMMGVTDEELEHAKLEIEESTRAVYDSASGLSGWYLSQITDDRMMTPEEYSAEIRAVDSKRVMEACRQYSLDTVYTLMPEEVQ